MSSISEGPIQAKRGVIQTPFGPASELPLQIFFDYILPQIRHDVDPNTVLSTINDSKKSYRMITKQNRWRDFAEDPKHSRSSVHQTFKPLEGIVKYISNASGPHLDNNKLSLHFENRLKSATKSSASLVEGFPDAAFLADSELAWRNIAVCGDYQKDEAQNYSRITVSKITQSMIDCMRHDLRRRFVYGFTIENTDLRLWLLDRSRFLVSRSFNFITDHLSFVHFCLSILHAEPHQLGWDTSMIPLPDRINFDIAVRSVDGQTRVYRTQSMMTRPGSRDRLGKGTKVWTAVRIEDGIEVGPLVALKDCWVRKDRTREGDIIRRILRDIQSEGEGPGRQNFPNVEWDGDVFIGDVEPVLDCTRIHLGDELAQDPASESFIRQMAHYRLVLTPVCQRNIENETSLSVIYDSLACAAKSLETMHKHGWVHRDVSTGNVLLGNRPRLVDFEYAKQAQEEDDFSIGTLFFKALEVGSKTYAFASTDEETPSPPRVRIRDLADELQNSLAEALEAARKAEAEDQLLGGARKAPPLRIKLTPPSPDPFTYNPLHDLESLWWVAVYFLLKREVCELTPQDVEHYKNAKWNREKQRKWAENVFFTKDFRWSIMMTQGRGHFYNNTISAVHPAMRPVARVLEDLRQILVHRYTKVEKDLPSIDFSCADGIHERFVTKLSEISKLLHLKSASLVPLAVPTRPAPPLEATLADPKTSRDNGAPYAGLGRVQVTEKDARKGSETKQRRKAVSGTPGHGYNLRPRLTRS